MKIYECFKECPLAEHCMRAHLDVIGVPPAGRLDVDHYAKCPLYRKCRDSENPYECIKKEVEVMWWEDEDDYDSWWEDTVYEEEEDPFFW